MLATQLLSQLFNQYWFLIPVFFMVVIFKTPWFKGIFGEFIVNLSASLFLNKNDYHLMKNVTLPTEDGSTQIDHIIVSRFGVFVIETKNMKGWIFGGAHQKQWTQKIYRHSNRFQNPLLQNYKHVKTLEALLELEQHQIHSVVVFVGDSTFKTPMPDNVTYGKGYIQFIRSKTDLVLEQSDVMSILSKINSDMLQRSFKTNREHVQHVKATVLTAKIASSQQHLEKINTDDRINNKKKTSQTRTCRKCGNNMILRQSKKGLKAGQKFWGCAEFPRCRHIESYIPTI